MTFFVSCFHKFPQSGFQVAPGVQLCTPAPQTSPSSSLHWTPWGRKCPFNISEIFSVKYFRNAFIEWGGGSIWELINNLIEFLTLNWSGRSCFTIQCDAHCVWKLKPVPTSLESCSSQYLNPICVAQLNFFVGGLMLILLVSPHWVDYHIMVGPLACIENICNCTELRLFVELSVPCHYF